MFCWLFVCGVMLALPYYSYGSRDDPVPGHLKPLGSHRPPLDIETIDTVPDPLLFNSRYVKESKPVKFKGLLKNSPVIQNWQSDEYLRANFGNFVVKYEKEKKENRSLYGDHMLFSDFLDRYKTENIYMVGDLLEEMSKEWPIPSFLLCGGYMEHISVLYLWYIRTDSNRFSSGGTKSVLHTDTFENFHCVVSGTKTFVLIDKNYTNIIGSEHQSQGYYNMDVEAVDMDKYPAMADIPWYKAVIEPGDCLYLPFLWIHHVDSVDRNMGVNLWWVPFKFNKDDCLEKERSIPDFTSASNFETNENLEMKWFIGSCARDDGTIHVEDLYNKLQDTPREGAVTIELLQQVFNILVPGSNGVIRVEDLDAVATIKFDEATHYLMDHAMPPNSQYANGAEHDDDWQPPPHQEGEEDHWRPQQPPRHEL